MLFVPNQKESQNRIGNITADPNMYINVIFDKGEI